MDDFERQLQNALCRREPPPWLESKVLAAAREQPAPDRPALWERIAPWLRLRWIPAVVAVARSFNSSTRRRAGSGNGPKRSSISSLSSRTRSTRLAADSRW